MMKFSIKNTFANLESSKKDLLKGSSWILFGNLFSKVLVFCATIVVTHILTKDLYGQLGIIRSTVQMFIAVSSFGIGATATKYIAEYRNKDAGYAIKVYWIATLFIAVMAVIAVCLLLLFSGYIANSMLNAPGIIGNLRVGAFILFFSLMNGAQSGALSGFEDFKHLSFSNILNGILEIILLPLGAYLWGLSGAVLGFGSCFLLVFIYNTYHVNKNFKYTDINIFSIVKKIKFTDFSILYKFSFPIALSSWLILVMYWVSKTMIVKDADFTSMANYDVAEQFKAQLMFIPGILSQVLLPILTNRTAEKQSKEAKSMIWMNIKINVAITFFIFLIILLFGKYILIIYGKEYTNTFPLYILCFCAIIDSISNSYIPVIISSNRVWNILVFNLTWGMVLFSIYTFCKTTMVPENALAIAYLSAALVQMVLITMYLKKIKLV